MTRIAVIADTHDRYPPGLPGRLAGADEIWHLGDVCEPETLAEFEERRAQLKQEIAKLEAEIRRYDQRMVSPETARQGLARFDEIFTELSSVEQKRVTQLVVKEVVYTPERITLSLYELPFINQQDKTCWFESRSNWLPREDSNLGHAR